MKIIRLTTLLDFGGQERKYISFTEDKKLLKNDYIFAAVGHGGHAESILRDRGFEVVIFNKNPSISNLKNIWMLYKWFKKIKPDVVHTAAAEANFHGIVAAKMAGIPVIIAEEIGFPTHSEKAKIVFRGVYILARKVICVSNAVKKFLVDIKEIQSDKGIVIYNPVSQPKYFPKEIPNDFTIVCVGRLEKVKNQQLLIKAFYEMDDKSAKLILVGDGRERASLEQLIDKLELQARVTITGFCPEPEKHLTQAHLFVLPSLSEGFGIAVVEAMQQGLPCLCSNIGGIPEFVSENETGWLFNPKNLSELITKLNYIVSMPQSLRQVVGTNARNVVFDGFTSQKYIQNLETLYQELK
jgi:glycosyltransferase involved in cell wall biosynthesis